MATILSKEFSLKWNNFSNNLTSGFLSHLSENDLVDVTIAVEGQLLSAHKLVLSVCSPYFKNIFKENPCQHPVIILKDVKETEIMSLLKFMYQGEVNVKQEDLPTFLKVAQMLQIKGLVGGEEQIIPLLDNYTNISDIHNSEDITALSDVPKQESKSKTSDGSTHSQRITKKNIRIRKKHIDEDSSNSSKKVKNESNVDKNDVCLLLDDDDDEKDTKDFKKNVRFNETIEANNDNNEIMELSNESNSEKNSVLQSDDEPVIYRLSARGRPQLVHEGYVYNLTSRSKVYNSSHYRCAEQHRGCRGKCSVIAERFMPIGVHEHNHPPSYQSEHNYKKKKHLDTGNM